MERDRQGQRQFRGTIVCRSMQDNEIKATFYPSKVMFSPDPPDVQTMVNEAVDTAMEAAVKRTVLDELRKAGIAPQFQPAVSTLQEEIRISTGWPRPASPRGVVGKAGGKVDGGLRRGPGPGRQVAQGTR